MKNTWYKLKEDQDMSDLPTAILLSVDIDKLHDVDKGAYWDVLLDRSPFKDIQDDIEELRIELQKLREMILPFYNHHHVDGKVTFEREKGV